MLFISSYTLLIFLTTAVSLHAIRRIGQLDEQNKKIYISGVVMLILNIIIGFFPVALTLYHFIIIVRGETTYENLKHIFGNGKNPFKKSFIENIKNQL
mmetsp:Transcript_14554/g.12810  ORF Transcript_14554/g.12810 Transcript_14554/m.12810 type:complete len:98 (+) Transcript_14554:796-1089(+)